MISTTYHSQKAENRPPPSKPQPALRGGVSRREGVKRPPAFIPHKNRTSALPLAFPDPQPRTAACTGSTPCFESTGVTSALGVPHGRSQRETGAFTVWCCFRQGKQKASALEWPVLSARIIAPHSEICPAAEGFDRSPSSCSYTPPSRAGGRPREAGSGGVSWM